MGCKLVAMCFDANDPPALAHFWAGVLGWELITAPGSGVALRPDNDTGFDIRLLRTGEPKTGPNHIHFDLTSASLDQQQQTVTRALDLGATHLDVGQGPDALHVVLADPEGNELCVIEPGNNFLAECGFLGALSGDGSQQAGYFWSKALDYPLVWDRDEEEETAVRSPRGGPILSWGGPPLLPRADKHRVHLDLAPTDDSDQQTEIDRLISLGATRVDLAPHDAGSVVLADQDGHEFCVLASV